MNTNNAKQPQVIEPLLTPKQAADTLGIPVSTLARWRTEHRELIYIHVGRVIRYRPEDLREWIQQHSQHPRR